MAQEYFTDSSGNRVRAKHAVVYPEGANDVDFYNLERSPEKPIQMIFNFQVDLEELELVKGKRAA
jgi:hypothetical protein